MRNCGFNLPNLSILLNGWISYLILKAVIYVGISFELDIYVNLIDYLASNSILATSGKRRDALVGLSNRHSGANY